MTAGDKRKLRLKELIERNKNNRNSEIDSMLRECINVLYPNVQLISETESEQLYSDLQKEFPFLWWGRIDWENFKDKLHVKNSEDIIYNLKMRFQTEDYTIYALWGYSSGNSPVIKTDLRNAIIHIGNINSVGGDQWLYCPSHKFVIEFYHEGDIIIGFQG